MAQRIGRAVRNVAAKMAAKSRSTMPLEHIAPVAKRTLRTTRKKWPNVDIPSTVAAGGEEAADPGRRHDGERCCGRACLRRGVQEQHRRAVAQVHGVRRRGHAVRWQLHTRIISRH